MGEDLPIAHSAAGDIHKESIGDIDDVEYA
jgi:hypothetical protein